MAPLWVSSYVLMLRVPMVSLIVENVADFVSAYVIGNLLQMAFRFWAFRRFVFPDEFARNPDKALESTLTGGGIAEALEDEYEAHETVQRHPAAALPAPSAPLPDDAAVGFLAAQGVEDFVIQQRVDALHSRNVVELERVL